jgi:hypothetical protein
MLLANCPRNKDQVCNSCLIHKDMKALPLITIAIPILSSVTII